MAKHIDEGYEHEPHHDIVGMTANKISRVVAEQVDSGVRFVLTTIEAEVKGLRKHLPSTPHDYENNNPNYLRLIGVETEKNKIRNQALDDILAIISKYKN